MEALLIVLALTGLALFVLGVMYLRLTWTTLVMHRQAMHALHQELSSRGQDRQTTRIQEGQYGTRASVISEPLRWDSDAARTRRPGDPA
jgi:hypothetical protein